MENEEFRFEDGESVKEKQVKFGKVLDQTINRLTKWYYINQLPNDSDEQTNQAVRHADTPQQQYRRSSIYEYFYHRHR